MAAFGFIYEQWMLCLAETSRLPCICRTILDLNSLSGLILKSLTFETNLHIYIRFYTIISFIFVRVQCWQELSMSTFLQLNKV